MYQKSREAASAEMTLAPWDEGSHLDGLGGTCTSEPIKEEPVESAEDYGGRDNIKYDDGNPQPSSEDKLCEHQAAMDPIGNCNYQCRYCPRSSPFRANLVLHERIHTGEKPFSCRFGHRGFGRKDNLDTHERIHTGEKPYRCDVCHKAFARSDGLEAHVRIHTNERPFSCHFCRKAFRRRTNLDVHERIHTGEKPHKCSICGRRFVRRQVLMIHQKTHTQEAPYRCICGTVFKRLDNLKRHARSQGCEIDSPEPCG